MDVISAVLVWGTLVVGFVAWRRPARARPPAAAARPRPVPRPADGPARTGTSIEPGDDAIWGWLLGHQLAHGQHGFAGDPLPDGHLGSPSDLAFWGGLFADDPDDVDEDGLTTQPD